MANRLWIREEERLPGMYFSRRASVCLVRQGVCVAAYCWPDGGCFGKVSFAGILNAFPGCVGGGVVSYPKYDNKEK